MIQVLRLGHRRSRDARLTTHVCMTARAFGAQGVVVAEADAELERTMRDIVARFGGPFEVETGRPWKPYLKAWKSAGGQVVHLTMYGQPLEAALAPLTKGRDTLFVVGSEKVPRDVYELADANAAVGNQPHSEVAALAVALDRWTRGAWGRTTFEGPLRVVPHPRGKTLIDRRPSAALRARRTQT